MKRKKIFFFCNNFLSHPFSIRESVMLVVNVHLVTYLVTHISRSRMLLKRFALTLFRPFSSSSPTSTHIHVTAISSAEFSSQSIVENNYGNWLVLLCGSSRNTADIFTTFREPRLDRDCKNTGARSESTRNIIIAVHL